MDLRALRYFVEVVRQKSYTVAAQKLFVTQPTLSRQVADLEDELGQQLLQRTTRNVVPTEKGALFYRRAVGVLALAEQAKKEVMSVDGLTGEITIAAGEIPAVSIVVAAAKRLQERYPDVKCHFLSLTADMAAQNLRMGLADLAVFTTEADLTGFDSLPLPSTTRWGVLTRRDGVLQGKSSVTADDLREVELYVPRRLSSKEAGAFAGWAGFSMDEMLVKGTYNLLYNAMLMVRQGGSALCIEGIVAQDDELMFLPLEPECLYKSVVVWPTGRQLSLLMQEFLKEIRGEINACGRQQMAEP